MDEAMILQVSEEATTLIIRTYELGVASQSWLPNMFKWLATEVVFTNQPGESFHAL